MSLIDADKNSSDRTQPKLNADDNVEQRMSHETVGTTYRTAGLGVNQGLVMQQGIIQSYDANKLRNVFFGYNPALNPTRPVLRIAKTGIDAVTATNDQLIFNSDNNIFKVVTSNTATLSYDGVVTTFLTIPHGLSTIPIVQAYVQFPNDANFSPMGGQYVPMPVYQLRTGLPAVQCIQSADATNIYFRVHDTAAGIGSPEVYNFRYYILQETAN